VLRLVECTRCKIADTSEFVADSLLEETGFEPSVPLETDCPKSDAQSRSPTCEIVKTPVRPLFEAGRRTRRTAHARARQAAIVGIEMEQPIEVNAALAKMARPEHGIEASKRPPAR
jgi:hypothetical protein